MHWGRCPAALLRLFCAVSAAARRGALVPPPAGFSAMPIQVPPALRGGFAPSPCPGRLPGQEKNRKASKQAKFTRLSVGVGVWGEPAARSNWNSRGL